MEMAETDHEMVMTVNDDTAAVDDNDDDDDDNTYNDMEVAKTVCYGR